MNDEPTIPQPSTTQLSPSSPQSGGSPWERGLNRLGAYALVAPVAWRLPDLLKEDGWTGPLAAFLVVAVAVPSMAVHLVEFIGRIRGK